MDKVSVIVPVYNVEPYLRKCVDSVIGQTYTDLEIILVDDGSPDNCGKICDEYAEHDGRVKVIHKENGGLSSARNAGIDIATGDFIFFVDSDDWINDDCIECLYKAILKDGSDCSVTAALHIYEGDGNSSTEHLKQNIEKECGVLSNIEAIDCAFYADKFDISACGKLYKSWLFETLRFPEGKYHEDAAITYRVLHKCNCVSYISEAKYNYFKRNRGSISSTVNLRYVSDVIEISEQVLDYTKTHIPCCYKSCINYLLQHQIPTALNMSAWSDDERACLLHIKSNIKRYRLKALCDKRVLRRVKIACITSFFGLNLTRFLYKVYLNG